MFDKYTISLHRILKTYKFRKMKKLALLLTVATFAITSCNETKPAEEAATEAVEATTEAVEAVVDTTMAAVDTAATAAH